MLSDPAYHVDAILRSLKADLDIPILEDLVKYRVQKYGTKISEEWGFEKSWSNDIRDEDKEILSEWVMWKTGVTPSALINLHWHDFLKIGGLLWDLSTAQEEVKWIQTEA